MNFSLKSILTPIVNFLNNLSYVQKFIFFLGLILFLKIEHFQYELVNEICYMLGKYINQGHTIYKDFWVYYPPVIIYIWAFIYKFAGDNLKLAILFESFWLTFTSIAFYWTSLNLFKKKTTSLILSILFILVIHSSIYRGFTPDVYYLLPLFLNIGFIFRYINSENLKHLFYAGIFGAFAVLIKQVAASVVISSAIIIIYYNLKQKKNLKDLLLSTFYYGSGGIIITLFFIIIIAIQGAFFEMFKQIYDAYLWTKLNSGFSFHSIPAMQMMIRHFTFLTLMGLLSIYTVYKRKEIFNSKFIYLILLILFSYLQYIAARGGSNYYFLPFVSCATLFCGYFINNIHLLNRKLLFVFLTIITLSMIKFELTQFRFIHKFIRQDILKKSPNNFSIDYEFRYKTLTNAALLKKNLNKYIPENSTIQYAVRHQEGILLFGRDLRLAPYTFEDALLVLDLSYEEYFNNPDYIITRDNMPIDLNSKTNVYTDDWWFPESYIKEKYIFHKNAYGFIIYKRKF
jgi:hypothetical protein